MVAHNGQAGVDIDEGLALRECHVGIAGEESTDQIADETLALIAVWRLQHGRLE